MSFQSNTQEMCGAHTNCNRVICGDNLPVLRTMPSESIDMIYIDPPFNTGKSQVRRTIRVRASANGNRQGFKGKRYETTLLSKASYQDKFGSAFAEFLEPRLIEARRLLKPNGVLCFHIDYRENHICSLTLDRIFGYDNQINEIIWAYDYGGRSKKRWAAKHDSILVYAKKKSLFRINMGGLAQVFSKFVAPDGGAVKHIGPCDVWWNTIVPTSGREKTGYPTQKPLGIIDRLLLASTSEGDLVLDFFAGSGTVGESSARNGRRFILIDNNPQAFETMRKRLSKYQNVLFEQTTFAP